MLSPSTILILETVSRAVRSGRQTGGTTIKVSVKLLVRVKSVIVPVMVYVPGVKPTKKLKLMKPPELV
jgi:NADH:ubiquinone oxidoreductase subunit B-like Fe-S oxidoreductase